MTKNDSKHIYQLVEVKLKKRKRKFPFDFKIQSPIDAGSLFQHIIAKRDREIFCVMGLDIKGNINYFEIVHIGSLSETLIHPREIFKAAILSNSRGIIIGHNHPSGEVMPSTVDKETTNKLIKAGDLLGIDVLDHLIISEDRYYSIKENKTYYDTCRLSEKTLKDVLVLDGPMLIRVDGDDVVVSDYKNEVRVPYKPKDEKISIQGTLDHRKGEKNFLATSDVFDVYEHKFKSINFSNIVIKKLFLDLLNESLQFMAKIVVEENVHILMQNSFSRENDKFTSTIALDGDLPIILIEIIKV